MAEKLDSSMPGMTDGIPKFPRHGEPWIECSICGFAVPRSEAMVHYKSGKLVDAQCDDQLAHEDYMEVLERRKERMEPSEQKVKA